MSDTLTKKLRRAATLQDTNETPSATPNTIPQSLWPPDPCCQLIATAVANRKATDFRSRSRQGLRPFWLSIRPRRYGTAGWLAKPGHCAHRELGLHPCGSKSVIEMLRQLTNVAWDLTMVRFKPAVPHENPCSSLV